MLKMSAAKRKEACDEFQSFQVLVGTAGITKLLECEGGFPAEYIQAKAICKSTRAGAGGLSKADRERKKLCRIAKSQVHLPV